MLTVEDPAFWEGVEPVKFGVLPRLQDSVTVIGCASSTHTSMQGTLVLVLLLAGWDVFACSTLLL